METNRREPAKTASHLEAGTLSKLQRASGAGYRHHGYLHVLFVVLPALSESSLRQRAVRPKRIRLLDANRCLHRRIRTRRRPSALYALLLEGIARHGVS